MTASLLIQDHALSLALCKYMHTECLIYFMIYKSQLIFDDDDDIYIYIHLFSFIPTLRTVYG